MVSFIPKLQCDTGSMIRIPCSILQMACPKLRIFMQITPQRAQAAYAGTETPNKRAFQNSIIGVYLCNAREEAYLKAHTLSSPAVI